jgi:PTH1 family peptidyl-tRNA hydrolase
MKLIVGLGNYPKEYEFTRHNAGFLAIDDFCKKNLLELKTEKFNGLYVKTDSYIISKPLTFMNNSGDFVREIVKFFKIDIKDILIITDDIDSNFGSLKFRSNGSSGGQNGLKDIFNKLGTEEIKRIKIGTGRPIPPMKVID